MWFGIARRVAAAAGIAVALTGIVPGRAQEAIPDAETLAARIAAAQGTTPANLREVIVETNLGGTVKRTMLRRGDDRRVAIERGPIHTERGEYKGERWHQNANGLTVVDLPDPGLAGKEALTSSVRRVTAPFDAYVLAELDARGHGSRRFVDPATYRVLREEAIGPFGTSVTTYANYTAFGAQTLPANWVEEDLATHARRSFTRVSRESGSVVDSDVAVPAIRRPLIAFPAGTESVELPAKFQRDRIYVRLNIGNRGLDFLLDTGTSGIAIDTDVARQLGLTLINASDNVSAGRYTKYSTVVPEVRIGPLAMRDIVMTSIPELSEDTGDVKVVGLLGFDFLALLGVTVDYERRRVTVVPATLYRVPRGTGVIALDVRLGDEVPMTSVVVDGAVGERFAIDTGADGTLLIFDYFARRHPELFRKLGERSRFRGVGGTFDVVSYVMREVRLSTLAFHNFTGFRVTSRKSYVNEADGVLGIGFLHYFTVGLDFAHGRVYLTPNADGRSAMGLK